MAIHRKSDWQRRIEKFMVKARQDIPTSPVVPDIDIRRLRAALIMEEALETVAALGLEVRSTSLGSIDIHDIQFHHAGNPNLIEIADGCADIVVVTLGTLSACGIADASVMAEVLDSNDSKFADGHYVNEIGKLIKSPHYKPARIDKVLMSQSQ